MLLLALSLAWLPFQNPRKPLAWWVGLEIPLAIAG